MARRDDLVDWVFLALKDLGGKAEIARICEHIWKRHERDLRDSGDLFFTWQYDMRWAGTKLVKARKITKGDSQRGVWELR